MKCSDRLLQVLAEYEHVAVITHDTPDPDAIAAGWAVYVLVRERLKKVVRLIGGGAIVRAENVHMLKLLRPPLELLNKYTPEPGCAPVLVDCAPEGANHLLGGGVAQPVAVIDHHESASLPVRVRYRDNRPQAAAVATIAASYLREQAVQPSSELATAMLYAVRTESVGRYRPFTRADRGIITWLAERADHRALVEIQNAPLSPEYFEELLLAIGNTLVCGDVAVCLLQHAASTEIIGEVADLLIRCTSVQRVLCGAVVAGDLILSARTSPTSGDATRLLGETLQGLGHSGGHATRAGGKIVGGDGGCRIGQDVLDDVKLRWLRVCEVENLLAAPLVPEKVIVEIP